MTDQNAGAPRPRFRLVLPSLNFLLVLLVFCGIGALLWHGLIAGRFFVFLFVVSGWIVSLCLHEFGHAATAYVGGDYTVARTGYLDLDPLRYTDPLLSLVLPVVFILVGGFGLPGGAVYLRPGLLRTRGWKSAVAAAGPLMNLVFLLAVALLYQNVPAEGASDIAAGLGVLALFQATAIVLNLLPFPGLDGFGIIRPYLPTDVAVRADQIGGAAFFILFLLIWLTPVGRALFSVGLDITRGLGIDLPAVALGFSMVKLF